MHGGLAQHSADFGGARKLGEARTLHRVFFSIAVGILAVIVVVVALSASAFSLYMGYLELSRRAESALDSLAPELAQALDIPEKTATPAALLDGLKIDPDVIGASITDSTGRNRVQFRNQDLVRPTSAIPRQNITWMRGEIRAVRKLTVRGESVDLSIAYTTRAAYRRADRQLGIFLASGFGGLLLVSLILRVLLMRQLRPWRDLVESMVALVDRDYDHRVPGLDRRGEIGEMARALESFRTKLIDREALRTRTEIAHRETQKLHARMDNRVDEFRRAIRQALREVTGLSDQMTVSADGLKSIATQTSSRADDVFSAIRQTSVNVASVAEASEELAASIREIERQVEQTNVIVADATKSTMESGAVIKSLYAKAEEIGEIIDLIQRIAAQTDLLALNATIEAARAGECGRGFGVVAHEVKSLANQTTHASKRVADHIRAIQEATSRAVDVISTIDTTMTEAEKFSAIISVAVEQQSNATAEISRNALEAARSADAAAGSMKRLSAAIGETDQSAAQVHHSSSDVGAQAQTLSATVDEFLEDTASLRGAAR